MNILVIGSGGREHCIIKKLKENPEAEQVYALPGNGGMKEAICVPLNPMDIDAVTSFALAHSIDFCVVTPDDPCPSALWMPWRNIKYPALVPRKRLHSWRAASSLPNS